MHVAKIIELVGSSDKSWEDAAKVAIKKAGQTLRGLRGVEVIGWTGVIKDNQISEYRATVKISFGIED